MIIKNNKFLLSKGLAFYSEKESLRLEEELRNGWHLKRIFLLGFYVLEKGEKEDKRVVMDVYAGKKEEIQDYYDLYQYSGWERITTHQRYQIFKGNKEAPSVYSDEATYKARFHYERWWLFYKQLPIGLLSLFLFVLLKQQTTSLFFKEHSIAYKGVCFMLMLGLLVPLIMGSLLLYFQLVYPRRERFYAQPERYGKRQRFGLDMVASMVIGGVFGLVIAIVMSYLVM